MSYWYHPSGSDIISEGQLQQHQNNKISRYSMNYVEFVALAGLSHFKADKIIENIIIESKYQLIHTVSSC